MTMTAYYIKNYISMRTNLKKRKKKLYTFLFSTPDPGKSSSKSGQINPGPGKLTIPVGLQLILLIPGTHCTRKLSHSGLQNRIQLSFNWFGL